MKELKKEIEQLKKEKNAVLMAHYYVDDDVQEIADYVGDSYYLAKMAVKESRDVICFAGVKFMGESAKILNPERTVVMPDENADCPMAHMVDIKKIQEMREKYDDLAVVCYINSTAEIKAYSDVCVTSSNAMKVVKALPQKNIFFIPDENLGRYIGSQITDKNFIYNDGYCPVHKEITADKVKRAKEMHPEAEIVVHPECTPDVTAMGDYIGSTSGIIDYVTASNAGEFIVCTESGVRYELEKRCPDKKFYFTETEPLCMDMKTITPEKILHVLKTGDNEVCLDEVLREESKKPLEKMLELAE